MRIAVYARVSTGRQEKEETIDSQIAQLEEYAKSNGYIIVERYIDDGWSGELLARPALDQLRDDALKKQLENVLITCPDRLARKYVYQEIVIEELQKAEVQVIFLNRPIADTPEDRMLLGIQGIVAEYEKEKIKERTRRGKLHKAKKGLVVGGIPPYGYRYVKKTESKQGYYEIMGEETKVVQAMFNWLIQEQMSVRAITKELTNTGISPPRKGRKWAESSVARILKNETYAGTTYYNKHYSVETNNYGIPARYRKRKRSGRRLRPKGEWIPISVPPIISRETWKLSQKQLERNSELSPRNVKYHYLLRGLLECANCGSRYFGTPYHGRLYYRCSNRQRTFPLPRECNAKSMKASMLESVVWDAVCEAIQNPQLIVSQVRKLHERITANRGMLEQDIRKVETELSSAEKEGDRVLDAYTAGVITLGQLREQMNKIQERKERLEKDKARLVEKKNGQVSLTMIKKCVKTYCDLVVNRLDNFNFEEKQKFLRLLLDKVVLGDEEVRIKGVIPVEAGEGMEGNIASISS